MVGAGSDFPNGWRIESGIDVRDGEPFDGGPRDAAALMAHMSHELRTPLNAILGFSEIMRRELLGPLGTERYQSYAADIHDSGLSLLAAVEQALAVTQRMLASAAAPKP